MPDRNITRNPLAAAPGDRFRPRNFGSGGPDLPDPSDLSISDDTLNDLITALSQQIGTSTRQQENQLADAAARTGAPEDSLESSIVAAGLNENIALAQQVPQLQLAQEQSEIDAAKYLEQLRLSYEQVDLQRDQLALQARQLDQQTSNNFLSLFAGAASFAVPWLGAAGILGDNIKNYVTARN